MRKSSSKNCSKTKGGKTSEALTDINGEAEGGNSGFYACYLLTSLSPRHKGHTYIGFTVNPKRRIRQHNGEITMGATRTKKKRPWEMVLCIYGFPTQVAALQFEWAWQHPTESLAVRNAACSLKSLNGLPNKIKVAFTMLTLHTWQSMDLTVNFFSTKYMSHVATCPSLPRQMKVQFGSMDDLPCYSSGNQSLHNDENDWDLDPQDSSGSDGIEDLSRGYANSVDGNTHCFDATDTTTSSSTENQASQENHVVEPRDPFFLVADDDFQKHFDEVEHLNREYNTPMRDSAEKPANIRTTCMFTENDGCNEDLPFEGRSPLHKRDSIFLIEDDFQEQFNQVDQLDQEFNTRSLPTEDSGCNLVHPFEGRSSLPKGATDETQSSTFREIEVIDLFTPSPSCKDKLDNTRSKKRKVGSANADVIDLTRSPDFVQL